uniref:Interleukin-15-like n=1 Tax=Labrus bergylta TaxID=56723 RepID=A0A3Q3FVB0_9LABR
MTDVMTVPPVILVQTTCHRGQRARGDLFLLTCNLCQEGHKTQVWLCFLILSFLGMSTCAVSERDMANLKECLKWIKPSIEKSDALLYAPSANEVEEKCKNMSLKCYMLELKMVIEEEDIRHKKADCIFDFSDTLPSDANYVSPFYKIFFQLPELSGKKAYFVNYTAFLHNNSWIRCYKISIENGFQQNFHSYSHFVMVDFLRIQSRNIFSCINRDKLTLWRIMQLINV